PIWLRRLRSLTFGLGRAINAKRGPDHSLPWIQGDACATIGQSATSGTRGIGGLVWSFSGVRRVVCGALVRSVPLSLTPADLGVERTGSRMGTRAGGKKSGRNKRSASGLFGARPGDGGSRRRP